MTQDLCDLRGPVCVYEVPPGVPFRVNERREETARRRLRRRLRMCSLAHQHGCRATASDPLSLKLANARRLAGSWVRGGSMAWGERGGWGWISRFRLHCSGLQPVERRTLFMRRSLLCCSTRSPSASLRGSLHAEPNFNLLDSRLLRHPLQIPPPQYRGSCQCVGSLVSYKSLSPAGRGRRYSSVRPASTTKPNNADTAPWPEQYTARPARHGDTIGAMVRDVLYEVSISRGNYSSTTVVYKQCC